jgi:hypothetical protein
MYDLSFDEQDIDSLRKTVALIAARALRSSLVRCQGTHSARATLEQYADEIEVVVARGDMERAQAVFAAESVGMTAQTNGSFVGQGLVVTALNWCVSLIVVLDNPTESSVREQLDWAVRVWGETILE